MERKGCPSISHRLRCISTETESTGHFKMSYVTGAAAVDIDRQQRAPTLDCRQLCRSTNGDPGNGPSSYLLTLESTAASVCGKRSRARHFLQNAELSSRQASSSVCRERE